MKTRTLATIATLLVIVAGVAVLYAVRSQTPATIGPSPSRSPIATQSPAPSAPPTASPPGVPGLDDRFGLIVTSGTAIWLRPETDPQKRTTLMGRWFVASPDGTQVAFWRDSGGADELFVMAAARPDQERAIYKVPLGMQGVQIIWANDGSGLLFTHQRAAPTSSPSGPSVLMSTLVTLDLRAGNATTTVGTLTDGRMYLPIAWDRAANLAAAGESSVTSTSPRAPVMEAYVTIRTGGSGTISPTRTPVTDGFAIPLIVGSPDAKYVYARTGQSIRFWPLAEYSAGGTFQAVGLSGRLLWRPGTSQVAWLAGPQLEAYDVSSKSVVTLFRGVALNPPAGTDLQVFRSDGSAAVIGPVSVGPGQTAPATLVLLSSGTSVQFDSAGVIGSGFIAGVRLR